MYADLIEWWETDNGKWDWHAKSSETGTVLFANSTVYDTKAAMIQYVSQQFPDATVAERQLPATEEVTIENNGA